MTESETNFAKLVVALKRRRGVTVGGRSKKGFGATALCVHEKIFAMVSSSDDFVVKLSRDRVDALVAAKAGTRFEPARGRVMKEWLVVSSRNYADWLPLAKEALAFVGSQGPLPAAA